MGLASVESGLIGRTLGNLILGRMISTHYLIACHILRFIIGVTLRYLQKIDDLLLAYINLGLPTHSFIDSSFISFS